MREAYSRLGASVGEAPRGAVGAGDSSGARENCEDAGLAERCGGVDRHERGEDGRGKHRFARCQKVGVLRVAHRKSPRRRDHGVYLGSTAS